MKKSLKKAKGKTSKRGNKENLQKLNQEEMQDAAGGRNSGDMRKNATAAK